MTGYANLRTKAAAKLVRSKAGEEVCFDVNPDSFTMPSSPGSHGSDNPFGASTPGARPVPTQRTGPQRSPGHAGGVHPDKNQHPDQLTNIKCLLDGHFSTDVTDRIKMLRSWVHPTRGTPDPKNPNAFLAPEDVEFWLGGVIWITGWLNSLNIIVQKLLDDGRPCRAEVSFGITRGTDVQEGQNPTSRGLASYGAVSMAAGDSLASIAFREYGRASLWRSLAEINNVDDPIRVAPGTMILLPTLAELLDHPG